MAQIFNEDALPEIERVDFDASDLQAFTSEDDFTGLGVSLLVEAGSYLIVASSILDDRAGWDRDDAILGGLLVRLYKLTSALLDQVCQRRAEVAQIICRLAIETIVDLRYLFRHLDSELGDDFVRSSFRQERLLRDQIDAAIESRGGEVKPIEDRMLRSIDRAVSLAGISIDEVSPKRRNWGGKDTRSKAREVFGDDLAYIGGFSGMSQSVHGSWGDLMQFHLETEDGLRFRPKTEWGHPRPQLLTTVTLMVATTVDEFFAFRDDELHARFHSSLSDLQQRVVTLAKGHEDYLAAKNWPEI